MTFGVDDGSGNGTIAQSCDKSTPPVCTNITADDLAAGGSDSYDAVVTRPNATQDRPMKLTFTFVVPAGFDFVGLSGCDTAANFDPTVPPIQCTITDPFAYNAANNAFGTTATAQLTVAAHYSSKDPIPAACPTGLVGTLTATASDEVGDSSNTGSVPVSADPWADLKVTATAPATASNGGTITVSGTVTNLGPCDAPDVIVTEEIANGAGLSLLTYKSGTGICAGVTDYSDNGCILATALAAGASAPVSVTYGVDNVSPSGANGTIRASGFTVSSGYSKAHPGIADPNGNNNTADTSTLVSSSSGCSTSGTTGSMALLACALVLVLRKRRNA